MTIAVDLGRKARKVTNKHPFGVWRFCISEIIAPVFIT